jgi:hypothetical protein
MFNLSYHRSDHEPQEALPRVTHEPEHCEQKHDPTPRAGNNEVLNVLSDI